MNVVYLLSNDAKAAFLCEIFFGEKIPSRDSSYFRPEMHILLLTIFVFGNYRADAVQIFIVIHVHNLTIYT